MKVTILAIVFCCLCSFSALAQTSFSIKGAVVDSAENIKLSNTTITVLNAKDSILRAFTWASANGSFSINNLNKGKFLLLVTYPGYADYVEEFTLDSANSNHNFGRLNMILKSRLLTEVIIKGQVTAIKIKGDTTEFNAKAYKIQPNDKVEDLLKQLPGIQVDKDGKVTAQGQTVSNILVDGEEFFGDDPTLVTKNLRADMVDKVQLYDKKSDQATFTGIDDGVKTKTINIKLKEDKKTGFFGKADVEDGTNKYYQDQLLFNKFKNKEKLSFYGILSNTGKVGLGWQDARKYGDDQLQYGDNGEMYISGSRDDLEAYDGNYDGKGYPTARTSGVHYDNKWNADKESINTNYKIGYLQVSGKDSSINQNNLLGSIIKTNSGDSYIKSIFRQKLDLTWQIKLDTTSNLKIAIDGTQKNSKIDEKYNSASYRADTLLNSNTRRVTNNVDQKIFDASAFYTKKFKKTGRTLSFLVSTSVNQSNSKGYLMSHTNFYDTHTKDSVDSVQKINQYKTNINNSVVFNTNLTYTEPITKKLSIVFNYGLNINNGTSERNSYDSTGVNRYGLMDTALSNNFKLNQLTNQVGAIFNYKQDKSVVNFGTKIADVSFKQIDLYNSNIFKQHFINWQPQVYYQYRFSQQESLRASYNGSSTQPNIYQIQPVRENADPLNITIGNPDLKPSFNNSFSVNYNSYKVLTSQSIYMGGYYTFASNQIVSKTFTDSTGKTISQSVNLTNHQPRYFSIYGSYDRRIKPSDINIGVQLNFNGGTNYNYSNGALNAINSYTYSASLNVSKYVPKKYQFNLSAGPSYNINQSSLQKQTNGNGKGFSSYGSFTVYLPGKFQLSADENYQFTGKTASFNQDLSKLIINTSLIKTFFKNENLKFIVSGNDLLNQNIGFSRFTYGNVIVQNTNTSIKRYIMFSLVWDFSEFGKLKEESK